MSPAVVGIIVLIVFGLLMVVSALFMRGTAPSPTVKPPLLQGEVPTPEEVTPTSSKVIYDDEKGCKVVVIKGGYSYVAVICHTASPVSAAITRR